MLLTALLAANGRPRNSFNISVFHTTSTVLRRLIAVILVTPARPAVLGCRETPRLPAAGIEFGRRRFCPFLRCGQALWTTVPGGLRGTSFSRPFFLYIACFFPSGRC